MVRNIFLAALAVTAVAGIGYANQPTAKTVVISVSRTPATSGRQMYMNYCAPCHGVDGRGRGPMAAALKKQPADLALLSRMNGGKFPASHVVSVLQFGTANSSHRNSAMPVWGPMFGTADPTSIASNVRVLRISNLSQYLQTLQEK
ncbi:MAG TPA: cytochrome c [Terracidiphilus sp.]|nr:cytochrome c [Terracidiphilus sp.]